MDRVTGATLCALLAATATATAHAAPPPAAVDGPHVLLTLARANQVHAALGDLAAERGSTRAIRALGERERRDHRLALRRLREVARRSGVVLPPTDGPPAPEAVPRPLRDLAPAIRALREAEGPAFDEQLLNTMVAAHDATGDLLAGARDRAPYETLRRLAADLDPIEDQHRELAVHLAERAGDRR